MKNDKISPSFQLLNDPMTIQSDHGDNRMGDIGLAMFNLSRTTGHPNDFDDSDQLPAYKEQTPPPK